jgi:hypothetical protein
MFRAIYRGGSVPNCDHLTIAAVKRFLHFVASLRADQQYSLKFHGSLGTGETISD